MAQEGLRGDQPTFDVDFEVAPKRVERDGRDVGVWGHDACIIDEDVDWARFGSDSSEGSGDSGGVEDVGGGGVNLCCCRRGVVLSC